MLGHSQRTLVRSEFYSVTWLIVDDTFGRVVECSPHLATFHKRAVLSLLAVTMRWPSGENTAHHTASSCWRVASSWPLAAFHTRAVLSKLAVTMRWPSGENAEFTTQ